jgi:hypothetical protein
VATFSFEPALLSKLSNAEKGTIKPYRGSKRNKEGVKLTTVSEQFYLTVKTCEFSYKTTFARKTYDKNDKIEILRLRKKPLTTTQRAEVRQQQRQLDKPWSKPVLAWELERETYNVEFIRETKYLGEHLQLDTVVNDGRFDWFVESVEIEPNLKTVTITEEIVSQQLYEGHLYGGRLILLVKESISPVNKIISKLCTLQNNGTACSSGQELQSRTVKTCHASREKNRPDVLAQVMFAQCKYPYQRNKFEELREQGTLQRGDYTEHCEFDNDGKFLYREFTLAKDSHHKGWQEHSGDHIVKKMGVSEQYKPLSMPCEYKESESQDKPDAPMQVDLSEAEKKLRNLGFL